MINIKSTTSQAKHAINYIVIAIINYYQIFINKTFSLMITDIKDIFSIN